MKRKIIYALSLCTFLFSLTGCVKFNANMDIKKDKSMNYNVIYAIDTSVFGEEWNFPDEDKANLEKQGFSVSDYTDGNMKGVTISKQIKNIDSISTENDNEYSLSGMLEDSSNNYMFKVKKGFLKNTYSAKFTFNASESGLTSTDDNFDTSIEENDSIEWETDELNDDWITTDEDNIEWSVTNEDNTEWPLTDENSDFDLSNLTDSMSNMDLSIKVNLPYSALTNNASNAENNNKNLTWNLSSTTEQTIEFEFELYNITNICIVAGAILLFIVIIIILIVLSSKKKKKNDSVNGNNEQTPIAPIPSIVSNDEPAETIVPDFEQSEVVEVDDFKQQPVNSNQMPVQPNIAQQPNIIEPVPATEPIEQLDVNIIEPQEKTNMIQSEIVEPMNNIQPQPSDINQPPITQSNIEQSVNNVSQQETINLSNDIFGQPLNTNQNQNNNIDTQ